MSPIPRLRGQLLSGLSHRCPRVASQCIFNLGLVDAQVFLVAMHDAIRNDQEEFNKFRKNVRHDFDIGK